MKAVAVVATDVHLLRGPDGTVRTTLPTLSPDQLRPWSSIAHRIVVVGRVRDVDDPGEGAVLTTGNVQVHPLPHYRGPRELATHLPGVLAALARLPWRDAVWVGRMPEIVSLLLYLVGRVRRVPFVAYFVADPLATLPPSGRWGPVKTRLFRRVIRRCRGVVYVTQLWLQSRYPAPPRVPTLARSNVALSAGAFRDEPQPHRMGGSLRLVSIGTMGSATKGQDHLLHVLARLLEQGTDARLTLVGDGPHRTQLELAARELGVTDAVIFHGATRSSEENWAVLDEHDVFVSGSRSEGLPRSVIEAMARSMPVVATDAGGTAELLDAQVVPAVDEVGAFVEVVGRLHREPAFFHEQARRNLAQARALQRTIDPERFVAFLRSLDLSR